MARRREERDWEASLPTEYLMCRDTSVHHSWTHSTVRRDRAGFIRVLICTRCRVSKEQELDRSGYIVRITAVRYPDGYLRPKGSGRMTAVDNARLRRANLEQSAGRRLRVVNGGGQA